ncbi:galactokinase [Zhihengliuella halotolerans]|uniref:Galactokinase n=1 Tax=Zhihengliuella halotolerans TaxID=370736 RepID=A0A4Q8AEW4_9MICC|nr:galactokinase [Zhihengliuella halotolerans]RZU62840.1 galactokinase [Zhihengliuella halotolerans]
MNEQSNRQAAGTQQHFAERFGAHPDGVWAAPGRVNLIGEHTDYNEGFVLPFAIPHHASVAVRRTVDGILRVAGRQDVAGHGAVEVDLARLVAADGVRVAAELPGWARYVAGVFWSFGQSSREIGGLTAGYEIVVDSSVPIGAGLSSSAALECAVAVAVDDLANLGYNRRDLVLVCQRAENEFVGAPTGILDQSASLLSEAGHGLFLDCRTRVSRPVPLALAEAGLQILVIDTKVSHAHESGGYGQLRQACETGAQILGVPALRDVGVGELGDAEAVMPGQIFARVKHIVTENQRVLDVVALLEAEPFDAAALGELLTSSHVSMRDDFGNSCPEMDLAVETAVAAGAHGARMTGGGFGGSAIALVKANEADAVRDAVVRAFAEAGHAAPDVFPVLPSAGARRVS